MYRALPAVLWPMMQLLGNDSDIVASIERVDVEDRLRRWVGRLLLVGALLHGARMCARHLGRQLLEDAGQQRRCRARHPLAAIARIPLVQPKLNAEAVRPLRPQSML